MKPERVPADAARRIRDHLAAALPSRIAPETVTFGLNLRQGWKPTEAPHLAVFDDSGPAQWPIVTRPLIRITVFANGRDRANGIAGRALGVLTAASIAGLTIAEPSGLLEAVDRNTGGLLASFTVRARIRTLGA